MTTRSVHEIDWAAVLIRSAVATAPTARPKLAICNGVAAELPAIFEKYGILTPRRQCHFISEAIIEAAYFQTLEEYASGDAYDTRTDLGFTAARDGDGRTNKGFGIFQTTGPKNQRIALRKLLALGFQVSQDVSKVKLVLTQPKYAAWSAGIFWDDNKLNAVADRDPTGTLVGRAINRGNPNSGKPANGEADRLKAFKATWKELQNPRLLASAKPAALPPQVDHDPLPTVVAPGIEPGIQLPGTAPWAHLQPGQPVDRTGMSPEAIAALDKAGRDMAAAVERGDDMAPVLGESNVIEQAPAPGMDPEEHAEQVAAGEQPDAGPSSPNTPLPAEPVAPGLPDALLKASQSRLRDLGFHPVGTPDGEGSWRTVSGIAGFQAVAGLPVTGQLDKATMDAIWAEDAPRAPISLERGMTTVEDLKGKSEIIDAASKVKTASVWQLVLGGVGTATTAIVSGFSDSLSSLANVRDVFTDIPGWGWALIAAGVVGVPALYQYVKANRVQQARVQDQATGKTA